MGRARIHKRMEKEIFTLPSVSFVSGGDSVSSFQLEGGEEECQIKRIVLSTTITGWSGLVKIGLFQKQPSGSIDFSDDTIIYSYVWRNQQLLNETTTVRVPQGWYIGVYILNFPGGSTEEISCNLQLNYLSLD